VTIKFTDIVWKIKSSDITEILDADDFKVCQTIDSGMEATVYKVYSSKSEIELALKIWNKRPPANVEGQYKLLEKLIAVGIPVSKPYACGLNSNKEFVLLTSYDGEPLPTDITEVGSIKAIAKLLVEIHKFEPSLLENNISKIEDFQSYFFPIAKGNHTDITELVNKILKSIEIKTECFIHGDFNLGNILLREGKFTVIDWTNGKLGERRYDFAWASFLIKIYNGEEIYTAFVRSYTDQYFMDDKDIYTFEMLACLRWIWISRVAPVPLYSETLKRLRKFIEHHDELKAINFWG
jgi:aminoglycoside phosphotransferase (APT) family kinase protein